MATPANADVVVVELQAKLDAFNAAVKRGEVQFDQSMLHIATSATKAEKAITDALGSNLEKPLMGAAQRTRQLGVQIGQLGSSLGSGISPMSVFAQQASDFAYVLGGTTGAAGKLATFFSGPWGAALLAAGVTLGVMASKLHLTGNELEDQIDKLKEHAHSAAIAEQASRAFASTLEGVEDALRKNKDALDKLNDAEKTQAELAFHAAAVSLIRLQNIRAEIQGNVDLARSRYEAEKAARQSPSQRGELAALGAAESSSQLQALEARLASVDSNIAEAQKQLNQAQAVMVSERVTSLADPVQKIHLLADQAVAAATKQAVAEGKVGIELTKQVALRTTAIRLQEAADVKAAEAAKKTREGVEQTAKFIMPVEGRISSGFGARTPPTAGASSFHPAIDIAAPLGTPVKAAAGGVVITTGKMGGLGNVVIIDHGGGTISEYGHLSAIMAQRGQRVEQGSVIGQVGSTGISTGPHLDYRVRVGGRYVDPRKGTFAVDEVAAGQKTQQMAEQAAREADAAERRQQAFNNEVAALETKILGAQRTKLLSADKQVELSEEQIIHDRDARNASYASAVKSHQIEQADADILTAKSNQLATAQTMKLYADEGVRKAQLAAQLDEQTRSAQIEQLQDDVQNAKTGSERRTAMLKLLDAETELTRIKLQQIVDSTAVGTAEHELAQLKLQQLDAEKNRKVADINRNPNAMTPGQAYVQSITRTAGQLNEDVQNIAINGLKAMNDQLAEATLRFFGLGNMAHSVLGQIISDLVKLAIQQAIVKPIAALLFGAQPGAQGGGGGGLLGKLFNIGMSVAGAASGGGGGININSGTAGFFASNPFGGTRANGGRVQRGRTYLVGENGPEPFVADQDGVIISNAGLMRGGGSGGSITVHVVSDDEKFATFIGQVTDPRIAMASIQAARGGSNLARRTLAQQQMHQLG